MSFSAMLKPAAKAVHNRLSTDLAVMAVLGDPARLYDAAPEDPVFPYMTYGDVKSELQGGDGIKAVLYKTSLHVWSRYAGRAEVFDLLAVLAGALNASPITLETGQKLVSVMPYMDVLRAPDGRTLHGVLRVHLYASSEGEEA